MSKNVKDPLGDKMKVYEAQEANRKALPHLPLVARLDGRAFHTYTRGMERPFDAKLVALMHETTAKLVEEFKPAVGYTQSDEITLIWREPEEFDGRWMKLSSLLAGFASAHFAVGAFKNWPEKKNLPHFDCRVWQVPGLFEASEVLIWRENDAYRNSVSAMAQAHFSHKELLGKSTAEQRAMLKEEKGLNHDDLPLHLKRGEYFQRVNIVRRLTEDERARIPAKHRPPEDAMVTRSMVQTVPMAFPLSSGPVSFRLTRLFPEKATP